MYKWPDLPNYNWVEIKTSKNVAPLMLEVLGQIISRDLRLNMRTLYPQSSGMVSTVLGLISSTGFGKMFSGEPLQTLVVYDVNEFSKIHDSAIQNFFSHKDEEVVVFGITLEEHSQSLPKPSASLSFGLVEFVARNYDAEDKTFEIIEEIIREVMPAIEEATIRLKPLDM